MAHRRVPAPRHRSEGTPAKQGPDVSAEWFPPFAETKGVDRQGEIDLDSGAAAVDTTRLEGAPCPGLLLRLIILLTRNRLEIDLYATVLGAAVDVGVAGNRLIGAGAAYGQVAGVHAL